MIDLIVDDSPSDKGKQKVDVGMVKAFDQPRTSTAPDDDAMETSGGWPDFVELALVRAEEELPRWGQLTLEFRDAANPDAEPFFTLDDKDEVQHYEYVEGLRKHSVRSLRHVPPFLLGSNLGFDHGQELKEQSRRKLLFIRHESGVWATITR
jgi:hypothetical protein